MNRIMSALGAVGLSGLAASVAMAGNYHAGVDLICSECHTAHASQSHGNGDPRGAPYDNMPIAGGPHEYLLRFGVDGAVPQDGPRIAASINNLCLTCHDNSPFAPDIIGANTGKYSGQLRQAGALNLAGSAQENFGHSLGWQGPIPGSDGTTAPTTFAGTVGLTCIDCHQSHGTGTQYRNLLLGPPKDPSNNTQIDYTGKAVTFEIKDPLTTATNTKDVVIRGYKDYNQLDVEFEEPDQTKSAYGAWCQTCHNHFHGSGGDLNMGSISGGVVQAGGRPWLRHPVADVNIGGATTDSMTFVSSLALYTQHAGRGPGHAAKVMDAQHQWTGGVGRDDTITPSCFSCHKGHGNNNSYGLIFMGGNSTISEEGDGGGFRGMCHQCHIQGRDPAQPI